LIDAILPPGVSGAEAFCDVREARLHADEEEAVAGAVSSRRREFTTARWCARRALDALGEPAPSIPRGERGMPQWPPDVVGSITHCEGYRAAAVARASEWLTLGIDAEPAAPLPARMLALVASADERAHVARLLAERPGVRWDRLLFCAKEAIFKAWWPLVARPLGFDAAAVTLDPGGWFDARLTRPGALPGDVRGSWVAGVGLLATALAVGAHDGGT
jgi:4'-phosphopantetheinyl transferase EntD